LVGHVSQGTRQSDSPKIWNLFFLFPGYVVSDAKVPVPEPDRFHKRNWNWRNSKSSSRTGTGSREI